MDSKSFLVFLNSVFKEHGFKKRGNYWFCNTPELIKVINVQKSRFSNLYYLNYGFQIPKLIDENPDLHFFARLSSFIQNERERINMLLDFEEDIPIETRQCELTFWINEKIIKFFLEINTENELRSYLNKEVNLSFIPIFLRKYLQLE